MHSWFKQHVRLCVARVLSNESGFCYKVSCWRHTFASLFNSSRICSAQAEVFCCHIFYSEPSLRGAVIDGDLLSSKKFVWNKTWFLEIILLKFSYVVRRTLRTGKMANKIVLYLSSMNWLFECWFYDISTYCENRGSHLDKPIFKNLEMSTESQNT